MDEKIIIAWNVRNWVTVVLMTAAGFALLSLAAQGYHKLAGNAPSDSGG